MSKYLPYDNPSGLIVVTGHYGAGKTCVSVALALALRAAGRQVTLVDLDIVNPYFRAADAQSLMTENGIKCIIPEFANTNVDVPSIGAEISSIFVDAEKGADHVAVIDVGGDNGAAALGRFRRDFERLGYDMLFVASRYRPLIDTPETAVADLREIEFYSRMSCTHIVNNSNIGLETTADDIEQTFDYSDEICRLAGLPEAFTSVTDRLKSSGIAERHPGRSIFFVPDTTRKIF